MQHKLVSIILSVYNGEQYLEDCIQSVLAQSYKEFEFIIINDGSKDGSLSILRESEKKDKRIIVVDKENSGLTKSLNIGVKKAQGDYITRIDADDLWTPNKLQVQVDFMDANPDILLSGSRINFIDGLGNPLPDEKDLDALNDEEIRKVYLFKNPFCHSSVIFRSQVVNEIGAYNETFQFAQDYEYWYRIMKLGKVEVISEELVSRRISDDMIGISKNRNQRYNGLKTKIKVFADSPKSLKGILHVAKTFVGSIVPSNVAKVLRKLKN